MEKTRIEFVAKNGDKLYGYAWTIDEFKANVIIVTGMQETSVRYDDFAKFLNSNGFNVYCIDHYGQGENVPDDSLKGLGLWPKSAFRKMVNVIDELVAKLRLTCKPTYIFAHSMGSFMLQDYIQRYTKHVNRVILCGSSGKKTGVGLGYFLARLTVNKYNRDKKNKLLANLVLGNANSRIKPARTKLDWLSYSDENVDKYIANPKCGGVYSGGFYREFLKGLCRLYKKKFLKKIRQDISILIISGEDDPVGSYGKGVIKLYDMYKSLGLSDVTMKLYPHMRHEILNENEHNQVYEDILNFISSDLETDIFKVEQQSEPSSASK